MSDSVKLTQHSTRAAWMLATTCLHAYTHTQRDTHTVIVPVRYDCRQIQSDRKYFPAPWWSFSLTAAESLSARSTVTVRYATTAIGRQLSPQLPWRHGAAAQALKTSCIISWCVDTFAFLPFSVNQGLLVLSPAGRKKKRKKENRKVCVVLSAEH